MSGVEAQPTWMDTVEQKEIELAYLRPTKRLYTLR